MLEIINLNNKKRSFFKKGRGLHHEFGVWSSCEEVAGAGGQWGAAPGPAGGWGPGPKCQFRALSSEASGVSPFFHHLKGVQSKCPVRGQPGLRNKYGETSEARPG